MLQRILTSAVGLVIFFAALFAGRAVFTAAVVLLTLLALCEVLRAAAYGREIFAISIASSLLVMSGLIFDNTVFALVCSVMLYMSAGVFLHTKYNFKDIYSAGFLTQFITLFFGALIRLRVDFGTEAVFLVFLCAWGTDTGAYFAGRAFGKHKLIPKVSPKKTVEGAIGGVLCSVLLSCLYLAFLRNVIDIAYVGGASYLGMSVLAVIASVFSQIGDLTASGIKRDCGVKDFGTILPGHGGIMDRFDSVVFIAPMVLYFFVYFNKFVG